MFQIRSCLANGLVAGALASAVLLLPVRAAEAASETVVYSFKKNDKDGRQPSAGLLSANGNLYGTTFAGGANSGGTVFSVNATAGVETVLYSFCNQPSCADGANPAAGLIDLSGTLYGTTSKGGASGGGTVFSVNTKTGAETAVYSFCSHANCADGASPMAGLINVNGILYGTTAGGGAKGSGTVFGVSPKIGVETIVYSFSGAQSWDGANPMAGPVNVGGTFYGTTYKGGVYGLNSGTIFKFNPKTGAETAVYAFCSQHCWDGANPTAGLIAVNGALYGTTSAGGVYNLNSGTLFSFDPKTHAMIEKYAFGAGADGAYPNAGLIAVNGTLYGTTSGGGANGVGTVFSYTPATGFETVLHSFQKGSTDGTHPYGGLTNVNYTLFGTTPNGGASGEGTVFKVTLP